MDALPAASGRNPPTAALAPPTGSARSVSLQDQAVGQVASACNPATRRIRPRGQDLQGPTSERPPHGSQGSRRRRTGATVLGLLTRCVLHQPSRSLHAQCEAERGVVGKEKWRGYVSPGEVRSEWNKHAAHGQHASSHLMSSSATRLPRRLMPPSFGSITTPAGWLTALLTNNRTPTGEETLLKFPLGNADCQVSLNG